MTREGPDSPDGPGPPAKSRGGDKEFRWRMGKAEDEKVKATSIDWRVDRTERPRVVPSGEGRRAKPKKLEGKEKEDQRARRSRGDRSDNAKRRGKKTRGRQRRVSRLEGKSSRSETPHGQDRRKACAGRGGKTQKGGVKREDGDGKEERTKGREAVRRKGKQNQSAAR